LQNGLLTEAPQRQSVTPWRVPGFNIAITLAIVVGFFAVLIWEERSILNWTIRITSRHPRKFKQVHPLTVRPGRFLQELIATIDDKEVKLQIETSSKKLLSALTLSRIQFLIWSQELPSLYHDAPRIEIS